MSANEGNVHLFPAGAGVATLKGGGGDGISGDMEMRVKALEDKYKGIDAKLDTLVRDVAEIKGKISNMPATWQIVAICATLIALVIASGGSVIGLMRLLQP